MTRLPCGVYENDQCVWMGGADRAGKRRKKAARERRPSDEKHAGMFQFFACVLKTCLFWTRPVYISAIVIFSCRCYNQKHPFTKGKGERRDGKDEPTERAVPQTGDIGPTRLWAVLPALGAAGIAAGVMIQKRRPR